jgi:DNA-directed RNA polymerase subunit RPC12/RpoP
VKFVCEQCGKRFASTDHPVPGRTYRIRCRCGHVIVLPPASASAAPSAADAPPAAPRRAAAPPPLTLTPGGADGRVRAVEQASRALDDLFPASTAVPFQPSATDPFAPPAADPFAVAPDPFAAPAPDAAKAAPPASDPFALGALPDPFGSGDPFAPPPSVPTRRRDPYAGQDPFSPSSAPPQREHAAAPPATAVSTGDVLGPATPTRAIAIATADVLGPMTPAGTPPPFVYPPALVEREQPEREGSGELSLELSMSDETPLPPEPAAARRRWPPAAGVAALAVAVAAVAVFVLRATQGPAVVVTGRAENAPVAAKHGPAALASTATPLPPAVAVSTPASAPPPPTAAATAPSPPHLSATAGSTPTAASRSRPTQTGPERRERQHPERAPAAAESTGAVGFESAPAAPVLDPSLKEALTRKDSAAAAPAPVRSLDPAEVQAGIARGRPAFDACVSEAVAASGGSAIAGRRTGLLLLVAPSGRAEGVLEDPELAEAPLGACLSRAAARLSFPPFDGEPVAVRVPIVVGAR